METYLNQHFAGVKPKHSSDETLKKWRTLCGVVKNLKRRFRFTANLTKRDEAAAMRHSNQEKLRAVVLVSKAAFQFIQGVTPTDYIVPEDVQAAGFEICADEVGSIVESHNMKKLKFNGGVKGVATKLVTSTTDGLSANYYELAHRQELFGIKLCEYHVSC